VQLKKLSPSIHCPMLKGINKDSIRTVAIIT